MKNKNLLLFAYWCSRATYLDFSSYISALKHLQAGVSLQDRAFTDRWASTFPWLFTNIMMDFDRDAEILLRWDRSGIDMVTPLDSRFPPLLSKIHDPPVLLYGRGDWSCLRRPCMAVVGSREPSNISLSWMESELGQFLSKIRCTIISGGARGVDLAAHRIAMRKSEPTVVLFPSGLEQMYPSNWQSENLAWSQSVLKSGGLLLSEYAPPVMMKKDHFIARNRLISGLSMATLLVEARLRSGTLVTAKSALDQNRSLYILPSHPFDTNSRGGLNLLSEGATLIRDAEDLSLFFGSELVDRGDAFTTNWLPENLAH